ncbi:hypothetical protein CC85DRAFT_206078 [Cutaneotrichosporon oleaginosum]|uniref:Uncharacterized protein n=1 Tax=Cutaneotrichosporon oleaginosum TaxID=879819 RepID=A0A0J1AV51_9TREE|nr:uncharacterized protein CC85DRAFT_206078 [Cutaneotrichosporon oleaginosum]KLT39174.1 hypothetical protein CC85DRAFT_206078 [Cutaneotrichosporon oleaginosum]TXT05308.1 hypothetical protein COLE_06628 [Cutaneotrichosporon oleaginosum]
MAPKRKRGDEVARSDVVHRPAPGTKSFPTGRAVRDGLTTGTRQALVSFHQQILTPYSSLPLAISHATVLILQHYLDVSPTVDEIFAAWKAADEAKSDQLAQTAAHLLALILRILTPLPFFHKQLVGIVNKLVTPSEPYHASLGRLVASGNRDNIHAGLDLAAAAANVDTPDVTNLLGSSRGRLAVKVWQAVVDGGAAKNFGKLLQMRRRNKDGTTAEYGVDPLDRADIRHLGIHLLLPLLPTTEFHAHAKSILPNLTNGLMDDPPVTVYRVLSAMWGAISGPPPGVARRISLVLLDEGALSNISRLLSREAVEESSERAVGDIAKGFLESVTSNPMRGICFPDEGWYERQDEDSKQKRGLHNRIISNVVRKLGARVVDDDGRVGGWVLKVFEACPELVAGYWSYSALALDPRLDARWIATMAYVGRVISLPLPAREKFNQPAPRGTSAASMPPRATPPAVGIVVESVLPSPMTKQHLTKGLQHSSHLVQHVTALALARGLQKLSAVQALYASIADELGENSEGPWRAGARELEAECRRRVPEVSTLIEFAQKSATMARPPPDADEDWEPEPSAAARSAMLTETALRLFGLYHRTLPSLAGEAKFDVGRLLVSASSKNQERRARREAREGSVVSDSGSVVSIGTVGTVGMGGGFGHSRGDVEGFEALSQLHVLRLLSEVSGWNWTNKASGSQFTYIYHILQLHLSTRNVVTQAMTTTLLHRLLEPSLLFEHDTLELPIWLNALPRASDAVSGPMFIAQQIHLLSFLDECVRRALKTPHKYIEEGATIAPSFSPWEVASPLLVTFVEQMHAKLLGMHIATEAAAVVLNYLRRVLVGLLGKQASDEFVRAIVTRLSLSVQEAKSKGQPRQGLDEIISAIESDLDVVFKGSAAIALHPETPRLVDDAEWSERSFTRNCLGSFAMGADTKLGQLAMLVNTASVEEGARQAQFLVHFLTSQASEDVLLLLATILRRAGDDSASRRLKAAVFNDAAVRDLFLTKAGDNLRPHLAELAATLSPCAFDKALAEPYAHAAAEILDGKTKLPRALATFQPWIPFLTAKQVDVSLATAVKRVTKTNQVDEFAAAVLSALIAASRPQSVYPQLSALLKLGVYRPITALLDSAVASSLSRRLDIEVTDATLSELVSRGDSDAFTLLALLINLSSKAAERFRTLAMESDCLNDARILPAVAALNAEGIPAELGENIVKVAFTALVDAAHPQEVHDAARKLITTLPRQAHATTVAVRQLTLPLFGPPLAHTAQALAESGNADFGAALAPLIDLGLQSATRLLSSDAELSEDELTTLAALRKAIELAAGMRVEPSDPEPAITAAITERLGIPQALEFAAVLAQRAMLKASFVRQQLQQLVASRELSRLAMPGADDEHRLAFVRITHALFLASTYVSCQPSFVEPLVPLYRGTLGLADKLLLELFIAFEAQRKLSLSSVLQHWSPSGGVSARALDALTSLDPQKVFNSAAAFPLRRSNPPPAGAQSVDDGLPPDVKPDDVYDPVFVLALLSTVLQDELGGLDWVEILRSNVLGLAVCGLASRDAGMRRVAGYVLGRSVQLVSAANFHEQLMLLHTLELVAHSLPAPESEDVQPRLSPLITLFVAHALRAQAHPSNFLFPLSSRFLLQRPTLDVADVPLLYGMLYAAGDGARRERAWIVRLLRDGVRSNRDASILARRNTYALLCSLFQSSLDAPFRRAVLAALRSLARTSTGARALLRASLAPWIRVQWEDAGNHPAAEEVRDALLGLLDDAVAAAGTERAAWSGEVAALIATVASAERLVPAATLAFRLARADASTVFTTLPPLVKLGEDERATELLFRTSLLTPEGEEKRLAPTLHMLAGRVARMQGGVGAWARAEARRM